VHLDDTTLSDYLAKRAIPGLCGQLRVEPAGEGNINYVRRVRSSEGISVVVKHARPALERFPEYRVTTERLLFEHRYGTIVRSLAPDVSEVLPEPLDFDAESPTLVMEDLGDATHLERALLAGAEVEAPLYVLGSFLGRVHAATRPAAAELAPRFRNDEMRALHGEHIFTLPFEPNDFPIPESLRWAAFAVLDGERVRPRIRELRGRYYDSAVALVHGDVQGTNVLLQAGRPRLLDAEIAHVGDPAFDLGVARAHVELHLALSPASPSARAGLRALLDGYRAGGGTGGALERARGYAGVEMLRRTLGAARLAWIGETETGMAVVRHGAALLGGRDP
jgi:5-methylthioribose kinase